MYWCPEVCIYTQKSTESEKYIWIIQNVHEKSRFFYSSTKHSAVSAFTETVEFQTQPRINAYKILLQHDWLLVFSRQNRFVETHSNLQLSYHITDRLLAAGNKPNDIWVFETHRFERKITWILKIKCVCVCIKPVALFIKAQISLNIFNNSNVFKLSCHKFDILYF